MHYISNLPHCTILPQDLTLFESLAPAIKVTTDGQLRSVGPLAPSLRLAGEGACEVWYTPFDCLNLAAKLALTGIIPGEHQLLVALRKAREQLRRGASAANALVAAKRAGSFSGPLRKNLVDMLDHALDAYVRVDRIVGRSVHAFLKVKRYQVALFPQATSALVSPTDSSRLSLDELMNATVMAAPGLQKCRSTSPT